MLEGGVLFGFAFLLFFLPGFFLLGWFRGLTRFERVASAFGVSFLLFSLVEFVTYHTGGAQGTTNRLVLSILFPVLVAGWWWRGRSGLGKDGALLLLAFFGYCLQLFLLNAVLPVSPDFWYFDWIEHYFRSLFYLNRLPEETHYWVYTVPMRLPGFNLTGAFFLSILGMEHPGLAHGELGVRHWAGYLSDARLGEGYAVFQMSATLQNGAFFLAVILLARRLLGTRAALLAGLLLFFNAGLLHSVQFTAPKLASAYLSLLGVYFYLRARDVTGGSGRSRGDESWKEADGGGRRQVGLGLLAGTFAAGGFMSHLIGAPFLAGLFLHGLLAIWQRNRQPLADHSEGAHPRAAGAPAVSWLVSYALAATLVVAPWHVWAISTFGFAASLAGPGPALAPVTPTQLRDTRARFRTVLSSVAPSSVFTQAFPREPGGKVPAKLRLAEWHFNGVTGALTPPLAAFLLLAGLGLGVFRWKRKGSPVQLGRPPNCWATDTGCLWFLGGLHTAAAFVFHPLHYDSGIVHSTLAQPMLLLFLAAVALLLRVPRPVAWLTYGLVVIDFFAHWWLHVIPDLPSLLWRGGRAGNMKQKVEHQIQSLWDQVASAGELPLAEGLLLALQVTVASAGLLYLLLASRRAGSPEDTVHRERQPELGS